MHLNNIIICNVYMNTGCSRWLKYLLKGSVLSFWNSKIFFFKFYGIFYETCYNNERPLIYTQLLFYSKFHDFSEKFWYTFRWLHAAFSQFIAYPLLLQIRIRLQSCREQNIGQHIISGITSQLALSMFSMEGKKDGKNFTCFLLYTQMKWTWIL